jgi:thiol-disulfide isomerase/thioredoxin
LHYYVGNIEIDVNEYAFISLAGGGIMGSITVKLWAFVLTALLCLSSLSFTAMRADQEEGPSANAGTGPTPFDTGTTPRTVLAELFTNWDCPPCPYANQALNRLADEFDDSELALVYFHAWWPGNDDPFYNDNPVMNSQRINYYGIGSVPTLKVDGTITHVGGSGTTYDTYLPSITTELGEYTNLAITLTSDLTPDTGLVSINVTATDPVPETNLFLRGYVWEDAEWAQGSNGEAIHRFVARESLMTFPITINEGETMIVEDTFVVRPAWDKRRLGITVFVQSDSTRRVLQAATHRFIPEGILLVHDSQDMSMEPPFNEVMAYNWIPHQVFNEQIGGDDSNNDLKGTPPLSRMLEYGALIWHTSSVMFDTLNPTDEGILQAYLNSYGNLYITGENIGTELNDNPFFQNYLHGDFISDTTDSLIEGIAGDPIGGDWPPPMTLSITGFSPEIVNPADPSAVTSFHYSPGGTNAALRATHDSDSRVVYFPFMYFEGTGRGDINRDTMMINIISWLDNVSAPMVDVLGPDGGEHLIPMTDYDIEWSALDVNIPVDGVRIEYTLDSTSPVWIPIIGAEPNDGVYAWQLPPVSTSKARVRVCVMDSMGLENCVMSDSDFVISDDFEPPEITSVMVDGQPQVSVPEGQTVSLTATLTDLITGNNDISRANYTVGFQNWPGNVMDASDGSFDSPTEDVNASISTTGWALGNHDLYVYGCDEMGNCNITSTQYARVTITTGETQPPEISNVNIDGETTKTYNLSVKPSAVTLQALVDDTSTGDSPIAGANYTAPTATSWPGIAMDASDGLFNESLEWIDATISTPGTAGSYDYYVYAWDISPNYNNSAPHATLVVIDDVPPEIRDVYINGKIAESIAEGTSSVSLTAVIDETMTGGSGVLSANYTIGPQNWPGTDMDPTDGSWGDDTENASKTLDTSSLTVGSYDICVYGRDASGLGNANVTGECAQLIVVADSTPPEISSILIDGQPTVTVQFSSLPIVCTITTTIDDSSTGGSVVAGANYTTPTPASWPGNDMNASDMAFDSPTEDVITSFYPPLAAGTFNYHVHAWDEIGNYNTTAPYATVVVEDDVPPEISNVLANGMPSITVSQGTVLTLTATASDVLTGNSNIVAANYTDGSANWPSSKNMDATDLSFDSSSEDVTATMDTSGWALGVHELYVYAVDSDNNGNVTSTQFVTIDIAPPDGQPPEISMAMVNGESWISVYGGDSVVLNATIADVTTGNSIIGGANYTVGPQNWSGTPMNAVDGTFDSPVEDATGIIDTTGWAVANHTVCIYAWDIVPNDNTTSTACVNIDILSIKPLPPLMTGADLTGGGRSDVLVRWDRSGDDGIGRDIVVEYDIYVAMSFAGPYFYFGNVPATDSPDYSWTCSGCGVGDISNYFFYVEADDGSLTRASPNKASKFITSLTEGPQLISVPLITSSDDISFVLQTIRFNMAYYYDSGDASDPWKSYMPFKTYKGDLRTVDKTMGLWVNVTSASDFVVAGLVPETTTITLRAGWNLVGFPSFATDYTVTDLRIDVNASNIEEPDPMAPPYCLRKMSDVDTLLTGRGYWIEVPDDVFWTLAN